MPKSTWEAGVNYHKDGEEQKPDYGMAPDYTATVIANTLPEAIQIVWREIEQKEQKAHLDAIAKAKAENVFPPDFKQIQIDALRVRRSLTPVIE